MTVQSQYKNTDGARSNKLNKKINYMEKGTRVERSLNTPEEKIFGEVQDEVLVKLHRVLAMAKFMNKLGENFFDEKNNFIMSNENFEILYDKIAKKSLEHAFIFGFEVFHHQIRSQNILDIIKIIEDKDLIKQIEFQFESLVKNSRDSEDEHSLVTNNMDTFFYMKKNFFFDELAQGEDIAVFFTIGAMVYKMHQKYADEEVLQEQEPLTEEEIAYDAKAREVGEFIRQKVLQIIEDIDSFDNDDLLRDAFIKICDTNTNTFMLGITLINFYDDKEANYQLFGAAFDPFQMLEVSTKYNDLMKESLSKLPNKRMNSLLFIETLSSIIDEKVPQEDIISLYACIALNYYQNTLSIANDVKR